MSYDETFPIQLFQQPIADRIAYFQSYTMAHPKLLEASRKLMFTVDEANSTSLIFLFGPTGVGKTTLLRRVTQKLITAASKDMEQDKSLIPIAGVEAVTPEFSNFDWKDFYIRSLTKLQDPCLKLSNTSKLTNLKLRMSLENALRQRHLKIFYIDEAQNLSKVASGRKLRDQTDCIKSLANITAVQFILAGTYDLLILRNLSAQLCRRSQDIHLERYKADKSEDLKAFKGIVQTFQRHLPLRQEPDLLKHWDFCYERSIGCIGILKDWLLRALISALSNGDETLTFHHLQSQALNLEQCMILLKEADSGEKKLEYHIDASSLRISLGLEINSDVTQQRSKTPINTTEVDSDVAINSSETSVKKTRRSQVGKPLPQRRSVGGGRNVN
jgi:energy-coupling factor transporter ATP-binding protein EcfA2